jgi:CheY-like chemotaxis protein
MLTISTHYALSTTHYESGGALTEQHKVVLIAEDEVDNREILRSIIEDLLGYRAVLAENGEEALKAARREKPLLVLMDLMMPVMDGFDAIVALKSSSDTASIPVIAVTALIRGSDRQRALEAGADEFISKPFDISSLIDVIERMLG